MVTINNLNEASTNYFFNSHQENMRLITIHADDPRDSFTTWSKVEFEGPNTKLSIEDFSIGDDFGRCCDATESEKLSHWVMRWKQIDNTQSLYDLEDDEDEDLEDELFSLIDGLLIDCVGGRKCRLCNTIYRYRDHVIGCHCHYEVRFTLVGIRKIIPNFYITKDHMLSMIDGGDLVFLTHSNVMFFPLMEKFVCDGDDVLHGWHVKDAAIRVADVFYMLDKQGIDIGLFMDAAKNFFPLMIAPIEFGNLRYWWEKTWRAKMKYMKRGNLIEFFPGLKNITFKGRIPDPVAYHVTINGDDATITPKNPAWEPMCTRIHEVEFMGDNEPQRNVVLPRQATLHPLQDNVTFYCSPPFHALNGTHGEATNEDDVCPWAKSDVVVNFKSIQAQELEAKLESEHWKVHPKLGYHVETLNFQRTHMTLPKYGFMYTAPLGAYKTIVEGNGACGRLILAYFKKSVAPERVFISHVLAVLPRSYGICVSGKLYSNFKKMKKFLLIEPEHVKIISTSPTMSREKGVFEFVDDVVYGKAKFTIPSWESKNLDHAAFTKKYAKVEQKNEFVFSELTTNTIWIKNAVSELRAYAPFNDPKALLNHKLTLSTDRYIDLLVYCAVIPDHPSIVVKGRSYTDLLNDLVAERFTSQGRKCMYRMAPPMASIKLSGESKVIQPDLAVASKNESLIKAGEKLGIRFTGYETNAQVTPLRQWYYLNDLHPANALIYNDLINVWYIDPTSTEKVETAFAAPNLDDIVVAPLLPKEVIPLEIKEEAPTLVVESEPEETATEVFHTEKRVRATKRALADAFNLSRDTEIFDPEELDIIDILVVDIDSIAELEDMKTPLYLKLYCNEPAKLWGQTCVPYGDKVNLEKLVTESKFVPFFTNKPVKVVKAAKKVPVPLTWKERLEKAYDEMKFNLSLPNNMDKIVALERPIFSTELGRRVKSSIKTAHTAVVAELRNHGGGVKSSMATPIIPPIWVPNRIVRSQPTYRHGVNFIEKALWNARKSRLADMLIGDNFGLTWDSGIKFIKCQEGGFFKITKYSESQLVSFTEDVRPVSLRGADLRCKEFNIRTAKVEFTTDYVGNNYTDLKTKSSTRIDVSHITYSEDMVEHLLATKKMFLSNTEDLGCVISAIDATSFANFNCPISSIVKGSKMMAIMRVCAMNNTQQSNFFAQPNLGQHGYSMGTRWIR